MENNNLNKSSGGGMSYTTKMFEPYSQVIKDKVIVIDPEGEYKSIDQERGVRSEAK